MAKMIPPVVHPGCRSKGERDLFYRLKNDPLTENWLVLHSLDVANHVKQLAGEVDFLIIVPWKGVLCVEVKACSRLRCHEGRWYYGDDSEPDSRGPFKQAAESMHSIRKRLAQKRPDMSRILFWSAVVFPYVEFTAESEEWHPWQVIDTKKYRRRSIGESLLDILNSARGFVEKQESASWFVEGSHEPDPEQCNTIASVLRPEFEFFTSPQSRLEGLDEELKRFTSEQFEALDAMEANPRVCFTGPAGTGKTVLALEAARRSVAAGRRVLLVCFNRMLGRWLEEQTGNMYPSLVVGTLHSHMLAVLGGGTQPETLGKHYWEVELPRAAIEYLMEEELDEDRVFDELVVDEVQDILTDLNLDFLDLMIRGGLASGRCRLFGDFERQAIYGNHNLSLGDVLRDRFSNAPVYSLRVNCRNKPRVAELARLVGGLEPPYRGILRPDDGIEPEMHYYSGPKEQAVLLAQCLESLYEDGFAAQDIAVLSTRSTEKCAANTLKKQPWKDRLCPYIERSKGSIGYSSIHAFKGLEAPAVVVTDIDRVNDNDSQALLYIAVTRALHRLKLVVNNAVKNDLGKALLSLS